MKLFSILSSFVFWALIWSWMLYLWGYLHFDAWDTVFDVQSADEVCPYDEFTPEWYTCPDVQG